MQNNPTVVLGEASEESDVEDTITTSDLYATNKDRPSSSSSSTHDKAQASSESYSNETAATTTIVAAATTTTTTTFVRPVTSSHVDCARTGLSSNLFNAATRAPSFISKLVSYAPQSIIAAASSSTSLDQSNSLNLKLHNSGNNPQNSLLTRNLQSKDDQLRLSVQHMFKHPFDKASKDLHNVVQRLIGVQRTLLEVTASAEKIKREERNIAIMTPRLDY